MADLCELDQYCRQRGKDAFLHAAASTLLGLGSCPVALPKRSGTDFGGVFCCLRRAIWVRGASFANPSFLIDVSSVLPILAVPTTCSFGTWSSIVSSFHGKGAWRRMRCACRKLCFGFGAAFTLSGRLVEGNRRPKWWILKTIISGTLELLLRLRGIPSCISFSSCKAALPWSPRVVFHAPRVARMCFWKCFALTLLERLVGALLELQDWILRSII